MKKQKLLLTGLLLTFPLLLANSPSPYPYPDHYEDFTNTTFISETLSDGSYLYKSNITNTGEFFIHVAYIYLIHNSHYEMTSVQNYDVVMPGLTYELVFPNTKEFIVTDLTIDVQAYKPFEGEYSISNIRNITREHYNEKSYFYAYELDLKVTNKFYYEFVTLYTYEGETYASSNSGRLTNPGFFSYNAMDVERITIENVYLVQGRARNTYGSFFYILIILIIIALILTMLLMIAIPITLTVYFIRRKNQKSAI